MTVYREVLTVIGVGGMGQAIARRLGSSKTVLLADNNEQVLTSVAESLSADGYDVERHSVDVSSPESVHALAGFAGSLGNMTQLAHTAGLSPAQAPAGAGDHAYATLGHYRASPCFLPAF